MDLIQRAAEFAKEKHAGTVRKYGGKPYFTHVERVGKRVASLPGSTDEMVAAGYMHDLVEDEGVTVVEIEEMFGSVVARLVDELTNEPLRDGDSRSDAKGRNIERLRGVSVAAKRIKMVDRIDNLSEMSEAPAWKTARKAKESIELVEAIGDADEDLRSELLGLIGRLLRKCT